jgi:Sulfotransferase family
MFWRSARELKRRVILHYHIFKNAGTTVDSILHQNFRVRFATFDSDDHNSFIPNHALLNFLEAHPELAAVASHHLRLPKPVDKRFIFYDIVFLRHPIARLWSTYGFYRRMDRGKDPLAAVAQTRDVREFFQLLIKDYPEHTCNSQVNLIANAGDRIPARSDLPRAAEIVKQASVLGVAELFDESAVCAECSLRPAFKQLDFSYVAQNVTAGRPKSLDEQLVNFQQNCGKDMLDELQQRNQLDLSLVSIATEELVRRFNQIPLHSRRLEHLRTRCRIREEEAANIVMASNHPNNFAFYASLDSN